GPPKQRKTSNRFTRILLATVPMQHSKFVLESTTRFGCSGIIPASDSDTKQSWRKEPGQESALSRCRQTLANTASSEGWLVPWSRRRTPTVALDGEGRCSSSERRARGP